MHSRDTGPALCNTPTPSKGPQLLLPNSVSSSPWPPLAFSGASAHIRPERNGEMQAAFVPVLWRPEGLDRQLHSSWGGLGPWEDWGDRSRGSRAGRSWQFMGTMSKGPAGSGVDTSVFLCPESRTAPQNEGIWPLGSTTINFARQRPRNFISQEKKAQIQNKKTKSMELSSKVRC